MLRSPGALALSHEFFDWVVRNNDRCKLGTTAAEVYRLVRF